MIAGVIGVRCISSMGISDEADKRFIRDSGYTAIRSMRVTKKSAIVEIEKDEFTWIYYVAENAEGEIKDIRLVFRNNPLTISKKMTIYRIIAQAVKDNYSFSQLNSKIKNRENAKAYFKRYAENNPDKMKMYQERYRGKRNAYHKKYALTHKQKATPELLAYKRRMWHEKYKKQNKLKSQIEQELAEDAKASMPTGGFLLDREESGGGVEVPDNKENPAQQLESDEIYSMMWDSIKTLDPLSQEIASLIIDSIKDENIAQALGCGIDKVVNIREFLIETMEKLGF